MLCLPTLQYVLCLPTLQYVLWDVLDHPEQLRTAWLILILSLMFYVIFITPYLVSAAPGNAGPTLLPFLGWVFRALTPKP